MFKKIDKDTKVDYSLFNSMSPNLAESNLEKKSTEKECNILTLGASGTGKSTWINSIANYCKYESFNEALKHKPEVLIPALVKYSDADYNEKSILVEPEGGIKSTEQFENSAMSCTQSTQVYSFQDDGITYNIIDVPGVGDTRGVEYDRINMRNILDTVNKFESINMVCVLMKSTETRLNDSNIYCLNELLIHLVTKNTVNNIGFVLTNARGSDYRAGDALNVIKGYVDDLKEQSGITIPHEDNTFCVDSEAFKCQCICSQDPEAIEDQKEDCEKSWNNSLEATKKLLKRAREIKTISTREIINVNEARAVVTSMIKPLASISTLIQASVSNCLDIDTMKKDMMVNEYDIFLIPLKEPRMVCSSVHCIGKDHPGDAFTTYYKTICHDQCYLKETNIATFPEEQLKKCHSISDKGYCKKCSCSWEKHMHILYDQRCVKKEKSKINEELEKPLNSSDKAKKIGEYKEELEREQRIINESVAKFMVYLRCNAIMKYNDAYEKYLEMEITNANDPKNPKNTKQLEKLLQEFRDIKKFIDEKYKENSSNSNNAMTFHEINRVMKDLFNLRLYGEKLKEIFHVVSSGCFKKGVDDFVEIKVVQVNKARAVVTSMIKPLASITTLIQSTVSDCLDIDKMKKNLMVNEYDIFLTPLKEPRMVCASRTCIGKDDLEDPFTTYYRTICHDNSYLKGTNIATFPEEQLKKCHSISDKGNCKGCGCSWKEHMHILYDQRRVRKEKSKINEELEKLSNSNDKARKIEEYKKELEREQRVINESVAKFMVYLRCNAIMKYNNAYENYLEMEIKNANDDFNKKTQKKIEQLEKSLQEFKKTKEFIDEKYSENINNGNNAMTPLDINKIMNDLFSLRLYGEKLKEIFRVVSLSCIVGEIDDFIEVKVVHSLNN